MWRALRLTMFSHWTSSLWWFLGLPSPFDAYALVSWLRVKDQFIAYMRGTFQNNYIMPEYYQKGFSPTMVKDSFLVICLKFYPQTFGIFHTKPIILISWYYLWVQILRQRNYYQFFVSFNYHVQIIFSCIVDSRTVQNSCKKSLDLAQNIYL